MTADIHGAVESLEIFRVPKQSGELWEFHIHWKTNEGKLGCSIKTFARTHIETSLSRTLARFGIAEQTLTGNPLDSLTPMIEIALQRPELETRLLPGPPEVTALLRLTGGRATIPIPIQDSPRMNHTQIQLGSHRIIDPKNPKNPPES